MRTRLIIKILLLLCHLFFIVELSYSQTRVNLSGVVLSEEGKNPLPGASIKVEKAAYGAIAGKNGKFEIRSMKSGKYTLLVSLIGYKQQRIDVDLKSDADAYVECILEEQILRTNEIIVSASKRVQSVQEVPVSVSLISSTELLERNITKLDEILGYIPGVSLNGDHISIRGSSGFAFGIGSRVMLLLDGFPLISGDVGDIKFDAMPIFDIERIEVIKGAGSALYGTSALGGVINIISKEATDIGSFKARTFAGIYTKPRFEQWEYSEDLHSSYGIEAGYSKRFGKLGFNGSLALFNDEGYHLYKDSKRYNIYTKFDFDPGYLFKISLTGSAAANDRDDWVYWHSLDSATKPASNTNTNIRADSRKYMLFTESVKIFNNDNFLTFKGGAYYTVFKNTFPQTHSEFRQSDAISWNAELQYNSKLFREILLTSGLNFQYNIVNSKTYGNHYQYLLSVYEQLEFEFDDDFIVNAGARLDYEQTQSINKHIELSPKIGAHYKLSPNIGLRTALGRGFRAASIAERFASVDFQGFKVLPNPNLKSEHSWTYEIGGTGDLQICNIPLYLDATFFMTFMTDLIEPGFTSNSYQDIIFDNITDARIRGFELSLRTFLYGMIGVETGFTAMEPIDLTEFKILKYRPKFMWYNKLILTSEMFELQFDYRFISKIERVDDELRIQVRDYDSRVPVHVLDSRLIFRGKTIGLPITFSINARNLFDYYYTEMVGSLAPTRYLGLQAELTL